VTSELPRHGDNPVLLTICIATVDRADLLRQTLACIVRQLTPGVEVLVVDGASGDHTEEVVRSFGHSDIRYCRLPRKGGVDHDFHVGVVESRGEFVWFFCDDDFFEEGAVQGVMERLKAQNPDLLVVNGRGWDDQSDLVLKDNFLGFTTDRRYPSGNEAALFKDVAAYITYIGAVVVRRELWLERPHHQYAGSELAHIGVLFHAPLPGGAMAIGQPFVRLRLLNNQWTERAFRIWMVNWPSLVWSLDMLPREVRHSVVSRRPWRNLGKLIVLRASGDYDRRGFQACIRPAEPNALWQLLAWAIACLPARPLGLSVLAAYRVLLPSRKLRIQQLERRWLQSRA
jgi:glycosyltransferase involved in cell wall biosynthesis